MSFIVGILTFFLVLNCLLLILLVLIQLPKKDAGAGLAFGGGTADALFGAGSGNALTKITKYATIVFFALAMFLGYLETRLHSNNAEGFIQKVQQQQSQPMSPTTPTPQSSTPAVTPPATNDLLAVPLTTTNSPAVPGQSK
jgi:preprotein translocase subunit SecG